MSTFKHFDCPNSKYLNHLLFLHLFDMILKFRDKGGLKFLFFKEGFEETFNSI